MKTIKIAPREVPTLTVAIGDKEYSLPLAGGLTVKEANALNTFEGTCKFYRKHIPAAVIDSLTIGEINQITEAWLAASTEAGHNPGKS